MIDGSELIHSFGERKIGTALPIPIDALLSTLVERTKEAGGRTTRAEILGSLILSAAHSSGEELDQLIHSFRLARMDDLHSAT